MEIHFTLPLNYISQSITNTETKTTRKKTLACYKDPYSNVKLLRELQNNICNVCTSTFFARYMFKWLNSISNSELICFHK